MYKHVQTKRKSLIREIPTLNKDQITNPNSFGDSFSEHIRYLHIMHHKSTICTTFKY